MMKIMTAIACVLCIGCGFGGSRDAGPAAASQSSASGTRSEYIAELKAGFEDTAKKWATTPREHVESGIIKSRDGKISLKVPGDYALFLLREREGDDIYTAYNAKDKEKDPSFSIAFGSRPSELQYNAPFAKADELKEKIKDRLITELAYDDSWEKEAGVVNISGNFWEYVHVYKGDSVSMFIYRCTIGDRTVSVVTCDHWDYRDETEALNAIVSSLKVNG